MTSTLIAGILLGMGQSEEKTKSYKDVSTDLIFDYPQSWTVKTDKYATTMSFLVNGQTVSVRLLKTDQRYPAGHWQSSVKMVEETNGNEVLAQWEEDLLGVPLLLTRYREKKGAVRSIVLVGLLYARTTDKMSFRLISPEPVAEEAEASWRKVLMSIRTVTGKLPEKEDPNLSIPVETEVVKTDNRPTKSFVLGNAGKKEKKYFKGPVRVTVDEAAGVFGYLPDGWEYEKNQLKLTGSSLVLKMNGGVNDLDSARRAWLILCGEKMSALDSVVSRIEPPKKVSKAGAQTISMIRTGKKGDSDVIQYVALGWSAGMFWIVESDFTPAEWAENREATEKLVDQLSVASS